VTGKRQHEADLTWGAGWVELPWALARKPGPPAKCVSDRTKRTPGSTPPPVLPCRGRSIRRATPFGGIKSWARARMGNGQV